MGLGTIMGMMASAMVAEALVVEEIFNFSSYVTLENSIMRPNGNILMSSLSNGNLYQIDPNAENPEAKVLVAMPGATALTGFAQTGEDKYVVAGGVRGSYHYYNETLYSIDFSKNASGDFGIAATIPDAVMLNGAASLPGNEDVILLADSSVACIWRLDLSTGAYEKVVEGDFLAAPSNASTPIGINGLKVSGGYAYFTNTYTGVYGRVPIDQDGYQSGGNETIAIVAAGDENSQSWDDFYLLGPNGPSLNCQSPDTVSMVSFNGTVTPIVGTGATDGLLLGCSSITVSSGPSGNQSAYVATKGTSSTETGGQVVRISL